MKKKCRMALMALALALPAMGQQMGRKIYNEQIDPIEQIQKARTQAKAQGKYVLCQVGGNWCPWCIRLTDFIAKDQEIDSTLQQHFVLVHTNYNPRKKQQPEQVAQSERLMKLLGRPARFGFPVLVVLSPEGKVIHIQDSGYLEEGNGYSRDKVLRFLKNWTPKAVNGK